MKTDTLILAAALDVLAREHAHDSPVTGAVIAEAAERLRELDGLRAETELARKAWLGDDYGHLSLYDALATLRLDLDGKAAEWEQRALRFSEDRDRVEAVNARLRTRLSGLLAEQAPAQPQTQPPLTMASDDAHYWATHKPLIKQHPES